MQHIEARAAHLSVEDRRLLITGRRSERDPDLRELTRRGTRMTQGRLWTDPNPDLRRLHERLEVYDDMGTTDPVLAGATGMLEDAAASARFSLQQANKSATAGRIKDFVHWALLERGQGQMDKPFADAIRPLFSFARIGFAYAEVLPKRVVVQSGRYAGQHRLVVGDLPFCEQFAHDQWVLDPKSGKLVGITQRPVGGDEALRWRPPASSTALFGQTGPVVSVDRLVRLCFRGAGNNFEGIGLFRPAIFPWRAKNAAFDSGVIAISRFGTPTPLVEVDRRAARERGYTDSQFDIMVDEAVTNAAGYIAQQGGWLKSFPGITYSVFGAGQIDSRHVVDFVALCDRQMLLGLLAQWILLGVSDVGSKASIIQHRAAHARFVENIVAQLVAALQESVVRRLVEWNFGPRVAEEHTPQLVHHNVDSSPLLELLGVLGSLMQSGVVKPTQALEDAVLQGLVGVERAQPLIEASHATPETARGGAARGPGVFKPGPGRPEGAEEAA